MLNTFKTTYYGMGAAIMVGLMTAVSSEAFAQGGGGNTFNTIAGNMSSSISQLPSLLSGVSYLAGLLFGVLGILKIKDHVENPTQTPLKEGAIRLAAGGALFALPMIFEAMTGTIGSEGAGATQATLNEITF